MLFASHSAEITFREDMIPSLLPPTKDKRLGTLGSLSLGNQYSRRKKLKLALLCLKIDLVSIHGGGFG